MHTLPFRKLMLTAAVALALSACGSSDDYNPPVEPVPPAPPVVAAGDSVVLTASGKLASFNLDAPATLRTNVAVTGLQAGEVLLGIDFRPSDGNLYGVGNTSRIYTLDPNTGVATLKSTLVADAADTTLPFASLDGTEFGVDVNPAADRLRVVGTFGQACASMSTPGPPRPTAPSTAAPPTLPSTPRPIPMPSPARPTRRCSPSTRSTARCTRKTRPTAALWPRR